MVDVCQEGDEDECRDQAKGHHAASWPRSRLASIVDKQGDSQARSISRSLHLLLARDREPVGAVPTVTPPDGVHDYSAFRNAMRSDR